MAGLTLVAARKRAGKTQQEVAAHLGVTQALLSQVESGKRRLSARAAVRAAEFHREPTLLPFDGRRCTDEELARQLGELGFPGFAHLRTGHGWRNPAEVLLDALDRTDLEARVAEGLPWLPLRYPYLDWEWLTREAKLRNRQNRLGFVVRLSQELTRRSGDEQACHMLEEAARQLEEARLAREDTLCQESWPESRRRSVRAKRTPLAEHWNLDTRLSEDDLAHYAA